MEHDDTLESGGPLAGLRVLDLSNSLAGAQASQTLADFGAEVVHVEPPGGSSLRDLPSFPMIGRGKKSMVLDLHDAGDAALAREMALGADVLIETFRPGVMERLGLGYEESVGRQPSVGLRLGHRIRPHGALRQRQGLRGPRHGPRRRTVGVAGDGEPRRAGPRLGAVLQLRGEPAAPDGDLRRAARARAKRPGPARGRHAGERGGVARHLELVPQRHHVEVPRRLHPLVAHRPTRNPAHSHGVHVAHRPQQGRALAPVLPGPAPPLHGDAQGDGPGLDAPGRRVEGRRLGGRHPQDRRVLGQALRGGAVQDAGRVERGLRERPQRVGGDHAARERTPGPPADAAPRRRRRDRRCRARPGAPARADRQDVRHARRLGARRAGAGCRRRGLRAAPWPRSGRRTGRPVRARMPARRPWAT